MAIYLSYTDGGDHLVDIVNDSTLNGSVITGGAGVHQITLTDSEIKKGNILLSGANNDNTIILKMPDRYPRCHQQNGKRNFNHQH